jgi:hypothetical protein
MVNNLVYTILFIVYLFHNANSQTISARAFTDKLEYQVGDYINYSIEISHNEDLKVSKPTLAEFAKDIDVIRNEEPVIEEIQGIKKIIYRFIISKYDSADVTIPPIPVTYQLGSDTTSMEVLTNHVQFIVRTLPVVTSAEIKDVKPPIVIPMGLLIILLILIAILIAIVVALYLYRRNQKKKQKKIERKRVYIIPPHVKALSELHILEDKKLWQQGLVKEYHTSITEIIRHYFEDRFKILAIESSTTEIMEQLTRVVLPENICRTVNDFLNNADLVKFAKYKPLPVVNEDMMKQAVDIVENTVPVKLENSTREKVNV